MSDMLWSDVAPTDWKYQKLKYVARFVGGGTPDKSTPEFWNGDIPWVSPKDMKTDEIFDTEDHITAEGLQSSATNLVQPGAALIVVRSGILRHSIPVAINRVSAAINQDLRAILPNDTCDVRYLARLITGFQAELLRLWSKEGATVESLEYDLVASTEIPIPPLATQWGIVEFLDRETADIDALIAAKQRLLDLLAEKRRAILAEAVMRGLNPVAALRPSGIAWLGDIPAHWEALDLKWVVASISSGVSVNATDQPVIGSEPGVLKTSAAIGGRFLPAENKAVWETEYERLACPVKAESIIVSRMNTPALVAESGYVDMDYPNLFLPDRLWQVELDKSRAVPKFIAQVLSAHIVRSSLSEMATGTSASMKNLSQEDLLNFSIPLPPLTEQQEIVRHVVTETAKIDRLRAATEHSITLLKERRGALIAAAVTGQIDIPEAA